MPGIDIAKYQQLYLQTTNQYLQSFRDSLSFYTNPVTQQQSIEQMFISIHSIKSQSLMMGYTTLGNYCMDLEKMLRAAKDSKTLLTPDQITLLQQAEQKINDELQLISSTGKDTPSTQPVTQQTPARPTNGKRILLVEDDQFFEQFYSYKLQQDGFEVSVAKNGAEGLQMLAGKRPDLILLDLIMPIKDGFTVLAEKSQLTDVALKDVPVIVFSTLSQPEDIKKAQGLGATDYVNKSFFDYGTLLDKIKHILQM